MTKHGKKYNASAAKLEADKLYTPEEAIALAKDCATAKFDETVEMHLVLGVDPRHAEQQVRDTFALPHGLGKSVRVLVFAQGEGARMARDAGADIVADDDEMINKIAGGFTDFDIAISTPEMMGKAGRLGRVLGPRGLMPNPKAGTVVAEEHLPRTIGEFKSGRIEFRLDKTGNLHVAIGKASFDAPKLRDNLAALMSAVKRARPASAKGTYIKKVVMTTTMGPGIKIDPNLAQSMESTD
ncbi:MAG: 50S ribosomal protein L1 [Anaerolineae bacterium]|nr:MAG: 50S ribosomal protein L1 [Anaerolineae bacterium]